MVNSDSLQDEGLLLINKFFEDNYMGGMHGLSMLSDPQAKTAHISFPKSDDKKSREKVVFVATLINLLSELEDNGYLTFIERKDVQKDAVGNQFDNGTTVELAPIFSEYINRKMGSLIMPSESLRQMVKNNFKSSEEKRHRHTMIVAWIALATSILFGTWGIWKDIAVGILAECSK